MSENNKLYVGNLPFASTAQDLEALFGQVGTVSVVEIIFDKFTGRSRGFYRKFKISRIALRELGNQGMIPGLTK